MPPESSRFTKFMDPPSYVAPYASVKVRNIVMSTTKCN